MKNAPTKFSVWLKKNRYTSQQFAEVLAEHLGVVTFSRETVSSWRSGKSSPRADTMRAIKIVTNNELTADDFLLPAKEVAPV